MKRTFGKILLLLNVTVTQVVAQEMKMKDLGAFQYTMVPSAGDIQWNAYTLGSTYGFPLAEGHVIGLAASYQNTHYRYFDTQFNLNTDTLEEMHLIMAGVFYRGDISRTWEIKATFSPVISSNLGNDIQREDLQYSGNLQLSKYWNGPDGPIGFAMGIGYGALGGKPDFYPLVYVLGHHGNWQFQIGYPQTELSYQINTRHRLRAHAQIEGSYSNISDEVNLRDQGSLTNARLDHSTLNLGIRHSYRLQPSVTSLVQIGYLAQNKLQLLGPQDNPLLEFNTHGSVYVSMGLALHLIN